MLEKLRNLKNTFEGKLLTVVLFVALVLSLSSLLAYAVGGSVTEKPGAVQTEQIAVDEQMPPADDAPVLPVSTNTVEVNEASVVFEAENAYVSVRDQVISGKALTVLSRKEIQFTATANAGYAIESVTAQNKAQAIVPVVAVGGTFSIAAEFVDSTLVVSVKAVAVPDQKVPGVATTPLEEPKKDVLQGENAANENQTIYTVTFTVEGSAIRTEKVVDGGTCAEPLNPDVPAGKVSFLGWYQKMGGSVVASERFDFAAPIHSNTELVAKFSDKWAVLFTDAGGKVIQTQEIANNETAQSIGAIPPPAGQLFDAWYLNGEPYDFAMPVTSNLTLTPHFATSHYVYFVSKGSAVDPQLIKDGQKATVPPQPSREGYDFRYWSATEGGAAFAFETEAITADTVLYGVWEGKTVQYTVVYNFEKPNILGDAGTVSENYQFSSQQTKSAPAGSTVSADTLNQGGNLSPSTASDLYKYGYYAFGNDTVISGNGDTVLNVYYKRTVYTLVFDLSGGTMTFPITGGQVYKNKEYSFKAKYEQNIEPQWVSSKNAAFTKGTDAFLRWNGSYVTHRLTMTSDLCDLASRDANKSMGSVTFTASWGAVRNVQVNYWLQVSDDAALPADAQEKNGKWFSKNNLYTQKLSLGATSDLLPKSIGGFKPGVSQGSTRDIYNFYYDRLTYKISFAAMGGSSVASVPDVRFEAPLAKHRPADPTRPNYAFKGWYLDSEYKISFSFDAATMPSSDMMLYPKWESSQYAANFYAQVGDSAPVIAQGVSQGAFVKDPGTYVVGRAYEGLGEFQGWYWYLPHTSYLVSYSWEAPVSGNLQLYGRWKTTGFALTYSAGVGQGAVPIDTYEYALDTHASVKNAVLTLAGKSFIGWQIDGIGRTYYSGNILKMKGTTKLVARYINPASAVYLTFNANYGNPSATEQWTAEKNDLVTLPGSMFSRPGHEFAGWNTQSDGKGASYGVDVPLLMSGNTVLYAQWREAPPVMLTYRAEAGGSTNPGEELVNPATGTPSGSSATAATNYRFDGWYIDAALISTNGVLSKSDIDEKAKNPQGLYQATTFTAKFSPKDVTLHFADNRGEVGYKTGKYGSKIAAGAMASGLVIDIGSAKAMALNYLNTTTLENKEQLLAAVANIPSLESLASLGFSFAFDGWASQPANSVVDPDVAQGVAPTTLEVSYQEKAFNGKSLFAGDSETVYAHYAMKYTVKKYTVAYTRGEYGTFADQLTPGLLYGSSAPAFRGIPEGASGYVFERWEPSVVPTVTNNATYTAQWKADIAVIATVNKPEDVIYNGQEQKWMPHITDDKGVVLVEGRDYELSYSKDVVNVGTVTVTIAGIGGYTGVVNRTYKITPAELILKANDSGKIFGETDKELTATVSGLIGSETFTGSYDLSRVPGENAGNYAIAVNNAVSGNPNYTVTVVAGTFAITAADAVSVIVSSATKPYDGTPLVPSANTPVGLRPGDSVAHLDYTGTLIDVGTTAASAENIKINDAAGNDVTGNYRGITVVPGTLSVTPAPATITVDDATKVAGAADPTFTGAVVGLVKPGDLGAITYSRTNADINAPGVYGGVLTAAYTANKNYTVTVVAGTFAITAADAVSVIVSSATKPYDGTPLVPSANTPVGLRLGDSVAHLDYTGALIDVGTTAASAENIKINDAAGNDVTGNYRGITVVPGTLSVTPVTLTIAANNTGKIYGAADPALTATVSGLIGSETFTGSYDLSRVPGENAGNYAIAVNNAVSGNPNYTVTVVAGTFAITAADAVSVIVSSATKPYDGTPLVPSANTPVGLRPGDSVAHLDYIGTLTDAGTTAASAENIKINDAAGNDVTGNYRGITVVPGTLSVTPAPATITVDDATKVAGAADPTFTGAVVGLVKPGDLGAITYSRTNADINAPGVYGGVLTAAYTANKNYTVTVVAGTFAITAASVVPVVPDSPKPPTPTQPQPTPTPGTPPANDPLAPIVVPIVEVLQGAAEAVIGDGASPLAQEPPREAEIGDNETPLADHAWCWVHWYILLGIAVTFVYSACTILHRGLFSHRLKKYEDDITGGGDPAFGGAVASGSRPSTTSIPQNTSATAPAASALDE